MIDCSKTESFLKEKRKMCLSFEGCVGCKIKLKKGQQWCREFCEENPEKAIAIVQKWSDEHSQKTMLDDFKEKYPNAKLDEDGIPTTCPWNLGYVADNACPRGTDGFNVGCVECWNRPYEEE